MFEQTPVQFDFSTRPDPQDVSLVVCLREDPMKKTYRPGDLVVYRKTKHSTHPGPRAENVHPAPNGDSYSYTIDKFWMVDDVLEDGTIVATTRRGKKNFLQADDPMLKRASLIERILYRSRFAQLQQAAPAPSDAGLASS